MNTCDHCGTELSYGQHHIEGTVVACNACGWASPMMERRYLDLSPSKETLANAAMTLDRVASFLNRVSLSQIDYEKLVEVMHAVLDASESLRYYESESRD